MQGLWYGDKRDRVKWGALVYLANNKGIRCIVQVAYFRQGPELMLQIDEDEVPLSEEVWKHFSDLNHIKRLEDSTGLIINVLDREFKPQSRRQYIKEISSQLNEIECPKIVFLDPDTGIAPKKGEPKHVKEEDIREIWKVLSNGDLLIVYQHADRTKKWLSCRKETMHGACGDAKIGTIRGVGIASDVAMLWCCKDRMTTKLDAKPAIYDGLPSEIRKEKKGPRPCACPCAKMTKGGYFCMGHDAKLKSVFLKVGRGEKSKKELDKIRLRMYEIWERDKGKRLIDIAKEVLG